VDPNTENDQEKKKEPWKLIAKSRHKQPHDSYSDPESSEEPRKVETKISENIERDLLCYKDRLNDQSELRISAFGYRGGTDIFRKDLLGYVLLRRSQLITRSDPKSDFYEAVSFTATHHIKERKQKLDNFGAQLVIRAFNEDKRDASNTTYTNKTPGGEKGGPTTKTAKGGGGSSPTTTTKGETGTTARTTATTAKPTTPTTEQTKQIGGQKRKPELKKSTSKNSNSDLRSSGSGSGKMKKVSSSDLVIVEEESEPKTNGRKVREGEEAPKKLVKQRSR